MLQPTDIAIVNGARTAMGRYCGKLRDFTAMELAAVASKEAIRRSGIEPGEIDHAVVLVGIPRLPPLGVVPVLLASPGVASRGLDVASGVRADPYVGPGRRHRQ